MKKAYIILENGEVFEGERFGSDGNVTAELVFTTGMGGYIETLTDPCYYGQAVVQTFPLIGNYGMISNDMEGKCFLSAYIVREWCQAPSNFRMEEDLNDFLKKQGIPGVSGVDTRQIARLIRENGVMNVRITDDPNDFADLKSYKIKNAVASVCLESGGESEAWVAKFDVAVVDFGSGNKLSEQLVSLGCNVKTVPSSISAGDIMSLGVNGVAFSDGPGDPSENSQSIKMAEEILGKIPVFGIGLGHQVISLAAGAKVFKLSYGHRGANQPVKDIDTGRVYITEQNHGYVVDSDSVSPVRGKIRYVNVNDGTCEGVEYPDKKAMSVQFRPDTGTSLLETGFVFSKFFETMEAEKI